MVLVFDLFLKLVNYISLTLKILKLVLFSLALVNLKPLSAQLLIGPVVGGNYSWIVFDDKELKNSQSVSPVFGYHAGIHLGFTIRKRFFLHTSIIYSTKGKEINGIDDELLKNKATYQFIEMPILYAIDFKRQLGEKSFKYFIGVGPNISYWLGGKGTLSNSELTEVFIDKQDHTVVFEQDELSLQADQMNVADPNRFQLGLNLGAGIELEPARNQRLLLTARFELGHTFFSGDTDGYFPTVIAYQDEMRARNQGLRLSASYLFDLKLKERKKGKSTINFKKRKRVR